MHDHILEPLNSDQYRIITITCLCAGAAFFDFSLFIYLSDLFTQLFFQNEPNDFLRQLHFFGLFATGYLTRPLGGLLVGRYGDTYGRRPALVLSIFGAAVFTIIIACLPTYQTIGMLAPLLLIIARFGQGLAAGGMTPSAWVFTTENLPNRNLGLGCGLVCATCIAALLLAMGLISFLENSLTPEQMLSYGWRFLFFVGGLVSLAALLLTRNLKETPIFEGLSQSHHEFDSYIDGISLDDDSDKMNSVDNHTKDTPFSPKNLLLILRSVMKYQAFGFGSAILISWIISSLLLFIPMLLAPLIANSFFVSNDELYFGSVIGLIFMVMGAVFFGYMVDRLDAGRVLVFGGLFLIIQVLAFFYHLRSGGDFILVFFALLGFATGIIGALPSVLTRLFPAKIRMTGLGLTYNLVNALVGGILPFALGYVSFYFTFAPAVYLALIGVMAIFISFFIYYIPRSERDLSR